MPIGQLLFKLDGRVGRGVFWIYFLVSMAVGLGLNFAALGSAMGSMDPNNQPDIPLWYWLAQIPMLWIGICVMAKRWHDQDRSGWWTLIGLIPLIGFIVVIVMCGFLGGSPGPNRFGDGSN